MVRAVYPLRMDPKERDALENLSKIEGQSVNQLLNEAIKLLLSRQSQQESSTEARLAALRAYRNQDPGFRRAIKAFVEAEAGVEDPLEGKPVRGQFVDGRFDPAGPAQSKVRDLLGA